MIIMSTNKLEILGMEGIISNYRRGRHTVHPKHCILVFPNIKTTKDAPIKAMSPARRIKGTITRSHGNSGAVRAHFKNAGVPGQALGSKVRIIN